MNLQKIAEIVALGLQNPDIDWRGRLLDEIAKDEKAIEYVLHMLNSERLERKKLVTDLNALLSKAHIGLEEPKINKDGFMQKEITEFYKTGRIHHCFNQKIDQP